MKKSNSCEVVLETATNGASLIALTKEHSAGNGSQDSTELRLPAALIGRIVAVRETNGPLIDFPGNASGELVTSRSLVPIHSTDAGREVALTFEEGDPSRPIILGVLQSSYAVTTTREVRLDDDSLVLSAKREVVIQCGKASITLTSAGKVLIRGTYLLSRSSGVNRIKGGSVQIN